VEVNEEKKKERLKMEEGKEEGGIGR